MEIKNKKIMLRDDDNDGIPELLEIYYTMVDKENELASDKLKKIEVFDMSDSLAKVWSDNIDSL